MAYTGTKVGADGRRYPAGSEPTDYDDYRPVIVRSDEDITEIAQVSTTTFGRSLLALPDADALSGLVGGGGLPQTTGPNASFASAGSSVATGYAAGTGSITANGEGAMARGYAWDGTIAASGLASTAFGYANNVIEATGTGAVAFGYASGNDISATAKGSVAFGLAQAEADIVASAAGAAQFGPGTNDFNYSFQVGSGIRLCAFPGDGFGRTPENGDMWVDASGNVMIRSNGVTKNISNIA